MSKVTKAIKAGLKASAGIKPPRRYQAGGIKVVCPHCKNDTFESREAMLNRGSSTALNLDWPDKSAAALVCTKCDMIQWFLNEPEVIN